VVGTRAPASKPYRLVARASLSRDGRRPVFAGRTAAGWAAGIDGIEGRTYDDTQETGFVMADGRIAYGAKRDGVWRTILDDEEQPELGLLNRGIAFSADGGRFGYQN